jgi:hypothetical protein
MTLCYGLRLANNPRPPVCASASRGGRLVCVGDVFESDRAAVTAGAYHFHSGLVPIFGNRCEETRWAGGPCRLPERAVGLARAAIGRSPVELTKQQLARCVGRRCRLSRQRQPPSTTDVRSTDTRTPAHPPRTSKPPARSLRTLVIACRPRVSHL